LKVKNVKRQQRYKIIDKHGNVYFRYYWSVKQAVYSFQKNLRTSIGDMLVESSPGRYQRCDMKDAKGILWNQ